MTTIETKVKKPRGFAAMDPEKVKELARKGGVAAHAIGTGHTFNHEEAVEAGRKGGKATSAKKKATETTPTPAPQG